LGGGRPRARVPRPCSMLPTTTAADARSPIACGQPGAKRAVALIT
jgi:hypothetical protein